MKLWIDDIRQAPGDDWVVARTVTAAIRILVQDVEDIEEISIDHDISHQVAIGAVSRPYPCEENFSPVAYFIGIKYQNQKAYPKIILHTSNPVGAYRMKNILKDFGIQSRTQMTGISANRLEMEA